MSSYAVSGFIDGLFKGIGVRQGWEDRKRNQKRQDRLDALTEEDHARRMRQYDRAEADWQYDQETRKTVADMMAGGGLGAVPGVAAPAAAPMDPAGGVPAQTRFAPAAAPAAAPVAPSAPAQEVAANLGIDPAALTSSPRPVARPIPTITDPQAARAEAATAQPVVVAQPQMVGPIAVRPEAVGAMPSPITTPMGFNLNSRGEIAAPQAIPLGAMMPVGQPQQPVSAAQPAQPAPSAPSEPSGRRLAYEQARAAGGTDPLAAAVDPILSPLSDFGGALAGRTVGEQAAIDARRALADNPGPAFEAAGRGAAPVTKVMPNATPTEKATSATTAAAIDQTAPEEVKAATVAGTEALGVKPGQTSISDKQYSRAGEAFSSEYMSRTQKVVEYLLSRGELEQAKQYQEFLDTAATKQAVKDIGVMYLAGISGDADKMAEQFAKVYNNAGYFPDGVEVVPDETEFTKDEAGNVTGVMMTFKDTKTGNTWQMPHQGDLGTLVEVATMALMPENAMTYVTQSREAAREQAKGVRELEKEFRDAKRENRKVLLENNPGIDPMEADRMAEEQTLRDFGLSGGGMAAQVPDYVLPGR